jgi:hypothetical protein
VAAAEPAQRRSAPQPVADRDADEPREAHAAPGVEVRAITYEPEGDRRVTLRIAGQPSVTLREGESAHGIDVQLIMPDAVYLRRGGNIFVASLRR